MQLQKPQIKICMYLFSRLKEIEEIKKSETCIFLEYLKTPETPCSKTWPMQHRVREVLVKQK